MNLLGAVTGSPRSIILLDMASVRQVFLLCKFGADKLMRDWPGKDVDNERNIRLEFALLSGLLIMAVMISRAM